MLEIPKMKVFRKTKLYFLKFQLNSEGKGRVKK